MSSAYWRSIPWAQVWSAFGDGATHVSAKMCSPYSRNAFWRQLPAMDSGDAFQQWIVENADVLQSIHLTPPPDRWIVFDVDVRGPDPPAGTECGQQHHQVCRTCWPKVTEAVAHVELQFHRPYLPGSRGLVVFSGNNGVHLWYPLRTPADRWTLSQRAVREGLQKALARLMPSGVDLEPLAPWHKVRCPLSWHETSQQPGKLLGWADDAAALVFPADAPAAFSPGSEWPQAAPSALVNPYLPGPRRTPRAQLTPGADAPASTWLRIGALRSPTPENPNRYGPRKSIPLARFLAQPHKELVQCSLIIPCVTPCGDIPSSTKDQKRFATLVHQRYFGYLDMDTSMPAKDRNAEEPMFLDAVAVPEGTHAQKMCFAQRLHEDGMTFGRMAALCPRFNRLAQLALALAAACPEALVFFSGGAGFRVLVRTPQAWRAVHWGDSPGYADTLVKEEILVREIFGAPPVALPEPLLMGLADYIDANVYHQDKGIKPDVHAHFETGLWPQRVRSRDSFLALQPARCGEDKELTTSIVQFWVEVLRDMPPLEQCTLLTSSHHHEQ